MIYSQDFTITQLTNDDTIDAWKEIAIDQQGKIHLTWQRMDTSWNSLGIFYSNYINGVFINPIQISNDSSAMDPSIDLGSDGMVSIAWDSDDGIYLCRDTDGSFSNTLPIINTGITPIIRVDSNDNIHLLFNHNGIIYTNNVSDTLFGNQIVVGETGGWPQFALDNSDHVHIVYPHADTLYYVNNLSGSFSIVDYISPEEYVEKIFIEVDSEGIAHIVWIRSEEVFYSKHINGSFQTPVQITNNDVRDDNPSLTIDNNGNVHIVYNSFDHNIYYSNNCCGDFILPVKISTDDGLFAESNKRRIVYDENNSTINVIYIQFIEYYTDLILATSQIPTTIIMRDLKSTSSFCLSSNYPNPFNPITTMSYQLPKSSLVNLTVYNVAGKLVETLVNEYKGAGFYQLEWSATRVGSGVYFYRIEAGEFVQTRKMILLK